MRSPEVLARHCMHEENYTVLADSRGKIKMP